MNQPIGLHALSRIPLFLASLLELFEVSQFFLSVLADLGLLEPQDPRINKFTNTTNREFNSMILVSFNFLHANIPSQFSCLQYCVAQPYSMSCWNWCVNFD